MAKKNKREEAELDPEADPSTQQKKKKKKPKKDKWGQTIVDNIPTVVEEEEEAEQVLENGSTDVGEVKEAQQCVNDDEEYDRNTIVVSGMPYTTQEGEIRKMFKNCGSIARLDLTTFPDTGNFKGLAFVRFEMQDAAKSALALDGMKLGGRFLKIEPCRNHKKKDKKLYKEPPAKANGCLSAYVGNLPWDVTENDIRKLLKDSKIKSIKFALDRTTHKCRGFGHVFFDDDESLENAIKKNQQKLHGRPIKIAYSVNY